MTNYRISDILKCDNHSNSNHSWNSIESEIGIVFPEDYKWFIDKYGVGAVNDFLWVISPFCENENLNSLRLFKLMKDSYEYVKHDNPEEFTFEFYCNGQGLFPWGITENGDELYWCFEEERVEIVVFAARYTLIKRYSMSMEEFLSNILTKAIKCEAFPDDFVLDRNYYSLLP